MGFYTQCDDHLVFFNFAAHKCDAGGEKFFKKLFILFFFTPEKEELITLLNSGMFAVKICK